MEDPNALNIYTDGSSFSKPRRGGIGVCFKFPDKGEECGEIKKVEFEGYKMATSQQMEMVACIKALEECLKIPEIKNIVRIIIHTDSMYIVNYYQTALNIWSKNGWLLFDGGPVLNADLWKRLINIAKKVPKRIDFQYVEGHSTNKYNNEVDKLAKKSSKNPINSLYRAKVVRRKTISSKTEKGSVEINGQKISIRIVDSEYLKIQKIYRYRYEVISKNNSDYKKMDFITSFISLKAGHSYSVRFNNNQNNPIIEKLFKEILP